MNLYPRRILPEEAEGAHAVIDDAMEARSTTPTAG